MLANGPPVDQNMATITCPAKPSHAGPRAASSNCSSLMHPCRPTCNHEQLSLPCDFLEDPYITTSISPCQMKPCKSTTAASGEKRSGRMKVWNATSYATPARQSHMQPEAVQANKDGEWEDVEDELQRCSKDHSKGVEGFAPAKIDQAGSYAAMSSCGK